MTRLRPTPRARHMLDLTVGEWLLILAALIAVFGTIAALPVEFIAW